MSEEAQAAASPRRFSARCGDACRDVTGDSIFQRGPRVHWQDGVQRSEGAIKVFTGKGGKFVEEKQAWTKQDIDRARREKERREEEASKAGRGAAPSDADEDNMGAVDSADGQYAHELARVQRASYS